MANQKESLKQQLIRLGYQDPSLRDHLRPILDEITKVSVSSWGSSEMVHEVGLDFELDEKVDPSQVQRALEAHPKIEFDGARSEVAFHRGRYYVDAEVKVETGISEREQHTKLRMILGEAIDDGLPGRLLSDLNVEEFWINTEKAPPLNVIFTFSVMVERGHDMQEVIDGVESLSGTLGGSHLDLHYFDAGFLTEEHEQPVFEADVMIKAHPHIFKGGGRLSKDKVRDFIEDTLFDNVASLVRGARGSAVTEIQSIRKD